MAGDACFLEVLDWGLVEYEEAFRRQLDLVEERAAGRSPDRLILVEHPPVVTLGRGGGAGDLRTSREALRLAGVACHEVDRGGQATFHGPGQLVAYPIIKLVKKDLHAYLDDLLETAAQVLRGYGLEPERRAGRPGLWVDSAKIASVGLAVRRWVTYHGLALNVNTDLGGFGHIIPCGRPEERLCSMQLALGRRLDPAEVKARFAAEFARRFGFRLDGNEAETGSRRPAWLTRPAPDGEAIDRMETRLRDLGLATVCQGAHCPNLGECFQAGTATFMILGRNCTRRCRFCAVDKGRPETVDPDEPRRVSLAVRQMGLRHAVVTSVTRDDLPDGGAGQFVRTIENIRALCPETTVEVLTPDFLGSVRDLDAVLAARPDVFNHNIETVGRLYASIRPQARYGRSLGVLGRAAWFGAAVKSGMMLGLGETPAEIRETLRDLVRSGCRYLTLGQYLAPSREHARVERFVPPGEFEEWGGEARAMGFAGVAAGPLVRSSYRAEELFAPSSLPKEEGKRGGEAVYR
ncbi:MAG: lipoyl synthase [Pseudomonadota bacterium]